MTNNRQLRERQERERQEPFQKTSDASVAFVQDDEPGDPAKYFHSFEDLDPGTTVAILCTESTKDQLQNLHEQERWMRRKLALDKGIRVAKYFPYVGPRKSPFTSAYRKILREVSAYCRRRQIDLAVFATNRPLRAKDYHPEYNFDVHPTEQELEDLADWFHGIRVFSWVGPNASPTEIKRFETKRGKWAKRQSKKFPGSTKQRREELMQEALTLDARGFPQAEIERILGPDQTTIGRWLKRHKSKENL